MRGTTDNPVEVRRSLLCSLHGNRPLGGYRYFSHPLHTPWSCLQFRYTKSQVRVPGEPRTLGGSCRAEGTARGLGEDPAQVALAMQALHSILQDGARSRAALPRGLPTGSQMFALQRYDAGVSIEGEILLGLLSSHGVSGTKRAEDEQTSRSRSVKPRRLTTTQPLGRSQHG